MNKDGKMKRNQNNLYFLHRWRGSNVALREDRTSDQMLKYVDSDMKIFYSFGKQGRPVSWVHSDNVRV